MEERIFAIGDIHGCATALETLLTAIDPQRDDTIVILGDIVDWGPDSRDAVERLMDLRDRCRLILILGNHEEALFSALHGERELHYWLGIGGRQTLDSYGVEKPNDMPPEHLEFLGTARDYHETETHIFVHANYWSNRRMHEQTAIALRWESVEPDKAAPHYSGKIVVAGHTPRTSGRVLDLGFLKLVDTDASQGGWLTALGVMSGTIIQANQQGKLRQEESTR